MIYQDYGIDPVGYNDSCSVSATYQALGIDPVCEKTACLVVNSITVGNLAFLFNCTPVGQTSDSMVVPASTYRLIY